MHTRSISKSMGYHLILTYILDTLSMKKMIDEKCGLMCSQSGFTIIWSRKLLRSQRNKFKTEHIDVDDVRDELRNVYPFSCVIFGKWLMKSLQIWGAQGVDVSLFDKENFCAVNKCETEHIDVDHVRDESKLQNAHPFSQCHVLFSLILFQLYLLHGDSLQKNLVALKAHNLETVCSNPIQTKQTGQK